MSAADILAEQYVTQLAESGGLPSMSKRKFGGMGSGSKATLVVVVCAIMVATVYAGIYWKKKKDAEKKKL
jgi:hypothetical protein